jgi:fatty-acyl-CoA synthase
VKTLDNDEDITVSKIFRSSFPAETEGFRTGAWSFGVARGAEELRPLYPTLLHALAAAAKLAPNIGVTLLPEDEDGAEGFLSYKHLYEQARRVAGVLLHKGFKKGDRALIVLPTSLDFLVAFFAVEMAGGVPVPSYPPAALEKTELALDRLTHVARHAGVKVCLTNRTLAPLLGPLALQVKSLELLSTVEALLELRAELPRVRSLGDDSAFIQYTSGSTGSPKGVLLSHRNLVSNVHAIGQALKIGRDDACCSWLPLYHDMGLIGAVLFSIYWRLPLVLLSPVAFLMRPVRWLEAISRFKSTLSAAPNFAYALCAKRIRPRERAGLDLSSWRLALNGAEPVNLRSVRDFVEAFAPHGFHPSAMYPVYGLAESSLAVTFPALHERRPGKSVAAQTGEIVKHLVVDRAQLAAGRVLPRKGEGSMALVSVGRPLPGHEVLVVDSSGKPVKENHVGHVVVKGPSVMKGYFQAPEATAKVLRGAWLWTGDLGFFHESDFYVAGRAKDLLIVRGKNYYAEDLERIAERITEVRAGGTVAFGVYDEDKAQDLAVLVVETKLSGEKERAALATMVSDTVSRHSGLQLDEVVVVGPGVIPKTSSGKRQRNLCRDKYLSGKLTAQKTGKLGLALVFARSGAGFLSMLGRRLKGRREPD